MSTEGPVQKRRRPRSGAKPAGTDNPAATKKAGARTEKLLEGLAVSSGIVIGEAHLVEIGVVNVPDYEIGEDAVEAELARFASALAKSERQLKKLKKKSAELHGAAAEELEFLLDAHMQMLSGSRVVRGVERRIRSDRRNAEAAVLAEIGAVAHEFENLNDPYLSARAKDVREVGDRLLRNLTETPFEAFKHLPDGAIVIAEELTPADTALLDPRRIRGFVTELGGAESHTAIMARSLALPAVLGVAGLTKTVKTGDTLIVDGSAGRLYVNPTAARLAELQRRQVELEKSDRILARLRKVPAITRDGQRVGMLANLELPRELDMALKSGAEGVGLLRSEYLFMNRVDLPSEDEQAEAYRAIVEGMAGRPVTIRTLDVGGDKLAPSLRERLGDAANPALGLRAIRLGLQERALLETQLAAILRAAAHGEVRILLPMISSLSEVRQVREIVTQVAKKLKRRGVKLADELPPIGIMIEVPGAALAADALAQVADFFAIGSNDLTQYTLAIDRGEEQVAHLYNPLHPAVLRLIQFATEAALRARIPVSVCGEIAGDPRFVPLLLGLGIQDLSMAPVNLPRVKQRIRSIDYLAATRCARLIMEQWDSGRIAMMLDDFNALAV
ncbi:phosphoenolpyruvate--protein phosphotransferase [Dongia mobilis]|uniref:Phosphoenolpyruvate-protein phosphotransferase n=1 Tax=Dongia mobilis TaxID=578943 RepID=A0A4R6WQK1_9PROT|nr:phosphoenolpyruvate--protein phosphotransferase [Dongia mobilis]TDQ83425.1 phosphoenolpyruvate--protein phosphotransferase [Dongia mobilis]